MAKYQIFTDSSSDLSNELRKQYGIEYFYFGLVVDGKEYRADLDWKDYSPDEYLRKYCGENNINLLEIRYDENVEEKLGEYFNK